MSLLTLIITIGKELLPFLKEALLEGQTFRAWLKTNWLTFLWLANTLVLTLMIAHLSDMVKLLRMNEREAVEQLQSIQQPLSAFVVDYKRLKDENVQRAINVAQLTETNSKHEATISQYQEWMDDCGLNYLDNGQCKIVRTPPRSSNRSKPRQPQRYSPPAPTPQEETTGFFRKLRDMIRSDKKEE